MQKSPGLNKIIEHLQSEKERFLKASQSGMFCDSENCLKVANIIEAAIKEIDKVKEELEI